MRTPTEPCRYRRTVESYYCAPPLAAVLPGAGSWNDSWVATGADLYNIDDIVIGSDVCISQYVYLCTGSHDRRSSTFEYDNGPIVIENGVWLCARSTVLRGVTVGANSVVGATSLVSGDIPPNSVVRPPPPIVTPS